MCLHYLIHFEARHTIPITITANPHLFIANDWIDAAQLRDFLGHAKSLDADSGSQRPDSPLAHIKLENDVSDASMTRLLATERVKAAASTPAVKTRILQEGERKTLRSPLCAVDETARIQGLSSLGAKKIQGAVLFIFGPSAFIFFRSDWWDHKAMSAWICPCLIKSQSLMRRGLGQHPVDNEHRSPDRVKQSLVESIENF
ncbi:hypothetical protein C8R44DRAFT_740549 [Mycena epipterygia]|nr:hypothetical protein C8R44DRAFT_740549 [Mycena epipterygia]